MDRDDVAPTTVRPAARKNHYTSFALLVIACFVASACKHTPAHAQTMPASPSLTDARAPSAVVALIDAGPIEHDALHLAARNGNVQRVEQLLRSGASIEATESTYGHTPLLYALEFSRPETALLLLSRGASTAGTLGTRALALAARAGAVDVIEALLARRVSVAGSFALHQAAQYGHVPAVRRLLTAGAPVNEVEPRDLWTPLLIACMRNQPEVVRVLLDAGASVTVQDNHRKTPLHWAVYAARPTEIHRYRSIGGPHTTSYRPQTTAPVVALLLARHAPINALDENQDTPLHWAAMLNARAAAAALLAAGANRTLRNQQGRTAFELARDRNNSVLEVLQP